MSGATIVTLYAREGCHLCDEAREAILALPPELGEIELREVDIETDDELLAVYLERIPVIELDGEVVSELEFDEDDLIEALGAADPAAHRRL